MLAGLLAAALTAAVAAPQARPIARQERLRPPDAVACDRNALTLYAGRVTAYERLADELRLTIATDWETSERVTLRAPDGGRLEDHMLLRGRRFTSDDWPAIEAESGRLREGVRVDAWICEGPIEPLLDWQPPREGEHLRSP